MNDTIFRYHCFLKKKKVFRNFVVGRGWGTFLDLVECPAFPKLDSMTHVSMEIIKLNVI
jgi:hypothetical protein